MSRQQIDETQFGEILAGRLTIGRLDRDWAAVRLLEYAPYKEIIRMLGFAALTQQNSFEKSVDNWQDRDCRYQRQKHLLSA